jgi:small conductance mechanosensitive channel
MVDTQQRVEIKAGERMITLGVDLLSALAVLVLGYLLVRYVLTPMLRLVLRRYGVDEVFVNFASIIVNLLLMILVAVTALDVLGINTGYLLAGLAAILIALVAAMQGWLQNVAGGMWMFLNSPFKLNDLVDIAGKQGKVEEIQLLTTKLRTRDNLSIIIPNRTVVANIITNFHAQATRRIEFTLEIRYEDDVERAIDLLRATVLADERVLREPEPVIGVANLTSNGVQLDVRPWVKKEDFSATRYALRKNIKYALDQAQIQIAYPQLQIHEGMPRPATLGDNR